MTKKFIYTPDYPVVTTKQGKLRGFFYDEVFTFYGIRYAYARRFEQPQEMPAWEGTIDATGYGYICPILGNPKPSGEVKVAHRFWPMNENCQSLNVWTNSITGGKKPVIVWYHGGGLSSGSSIEQSCYDGAYLAKNEDVVVVTVNTRLNAFGFMDLSAYGEKFANSANCGIADIMASLKWIRQNIAAFGGDPENVTVVGQSGGGWKVSATAQVPSETGLVSKIIIMSGAPTKRVAGNPMDPKELTKEVFRVLNIKEGDVEALQKVPTNTFISAVNKAGMKFTKEGKDFMWYPTHNEWFAGMPLDDGCAFTEFFNSVPTMVCSVVSEMSSMSFTKPKDEMTEEERRAVVVKKYGDKADGIIEEFKKAYPGRNIADAAQVGARTGVKEFVNARVAAASAPTYNALFALSYDINNGSCAWHCSDIPFFFHTCNTQPCTQMGPDVEALENNYSNAFLNFARTGDPNGNDLPHWDPVKAGAFNTMIFDRKCEQKTNFDDAFDAKVVDAIGDIRFKMCEFYDESANDGHDWMY